MTVPSLAFTSCRSTRSGPSLLLSALLIALLVGAPGTSLLAQDGRDEDTGEQEHSWSERFEETDFPQEDWIYVADPTRRGYPFMNTALYRSQPPVRYNRVEGLVLGLGLRPLGWDDGERRRIYGQIGYAFGLEQMRYRVGAESKLGLPFAGAGELGLKLGAAWHRDTGSPDRWKTPTGENSVSSLLFRRDRMDYYETQGWTAYAVKRIGEKPIAQLSVGYRSDRYRSLAPHTDWSVFRWYSFRSNPAVDPGRMHSVVTSLEIGRIRDFENWPEGHALRIEGETSEGWGGDFAFSRLLGDARTYVPLGEETALNLRVRGGWASESAPVQKRFTLGGVGSVRGYAQNSFEGGRFALANAELTLRDVFLFVPDLQISGLLDAGWTSEARTSTYRDGEMLSAGVGLSYRDRFARLELAWPLVNAPDGADTPAVWLRLNPMF